MLRLDARMIRQGIFFEIKLLLSAQLIQNEKSKTGGNRAGLCILNNRLHNGLHVPLGLSVGECISGEEMVIPLGFEPRTL